MSLVTATYRLLTYLPLEKAAESIAGEQTTGTFIKIQTETEELRARFGARVLDIQPTPDYRGEPLPGARVPEGATLNAGVVTIGYPLENTGPSIARILPVIAGNIFEMREAAGIKLLDVDLPDEFAADYQPPAFGVEGTRRLMGKPEGVMLGTIIKPNVGLRPGDYTKVVRTLGMAGIDFIKDDEVNADCPPAPLAERIPAVVAALDEVEEATGRRPLYAFNISDEPDLMLRNHDLVVKGGGDCVMVNINIVGLPAVAMLRRHAGVPVHGHMTGIGALSRHPHIGIGFTVIQKLARLAGVDHVHAGGFASKFYVSDDDTARAVASVREPLLGGYAAVPVISSAQWAGTAPVTWDRVGSEDLLVLAGGGMLGHPQGPAAGVLSMRQAWEATTAGVSLEAAALVQPELAVALAHFGAALR